MTALYESFDPAPRQRPVPFAGVVRPAHRAELGFQEHGDRFLYPRAGLEVGDGMLYRLGL